MKLPLENEMTYHHPSHHPRTCMPLVQDSLEEYREKRGHWCFQKLDLESQLIFQDFLCPGNNLVLNAGIVRSLGNFYEFSVSGEKSTQYYCQIVQEILVRRGPGDVWIFYGQDACRKAVLNSPEFRRVRAGQQY